MGRPAISLPILHQVGSKKEQASGNDHSRRQSHQFPVQSQREKQGEKSGAGKIAQRPHSLQSRHEPLVDFPLYINAIDIDHHIRKPQGCSQYNSKSYRPGIDRRMAQPIETDNHTQTAHGQ